MYAFNSGDRVEVENFVREHWAVELSDDDVRGIANLIIALSRERGELLAPQVYVGGDVLHVLSRRASSSSWSDMQFQIEEDQSSRISLTFVSLAAPPLDPKNRST